jgi:type VI secretion system protein ImpH
MAAEGRRSDPPVERDGLERALAEEPFRFEFFQAVWLLERLLGNRVPAGKFAKPGDEAARFGAHNTVSFPASEIQSLEWREGAPPLLRVNFMGLTGPLGVLPLYYTQLLAERARVRDTAARDFLDIFNHRIVSLFYQAWEKYRFTVEFERGGRDRLAQHLLDFIGLGTAGLEERQAVPDYSLIYYAGLLAQSPRSATALERLIEDYFEVPVKVEQFAGAWYKLEPSMQTRMEERGDDSDALGVGAVVGDEIWDEQARVRISIGPLTLSQYQDFLPTGTAYEPLRALVRFFSNDALDFEVRLVLAREEVPPCELGAEGEAAPRLGWVSWAKSAPMRRDPADAVLEL